MNKSHLTAIKRNKPSLPLKYLLDKQLITKNDSILDYGCGRGFDHTHLKSEGFNVDGYDPYWNANKSALKKKYSKVLCSYVLNVVDANERTKIIDKLKSLVKPGGKIYITVRRDVDKDHTTKRGTKQYSVHLNHKAIKENAVYCMYEIEGQCQS